MRERPNASPPRGPSGGAFRQDLAALVRKLKEFTKTVVMSERLRGEIGWVIILLLGSFAMQFVMVKMLASYTGKAGYGLYNLVCTAMILTQGLAFIPVYQPFIRVYHTAKAEGSFRSAGMAMLKWQLVVSVVILVVGFAGAWPVSQLFPVGAAVFVIGACFHVASTWRRLGLGVLSVRRKRKEAALQYLSWLLTQLVILFFILHFWTRSPLVVLVVCIACEAAFAIPIVTPVVRDVRVDTSARPSGIGRLVWTVGIPLGVLQVLEWLQGYSDRYMLANFRGLEEAGLYGAAFMISGIPFMLMSAMLNDLITPVAYQRAKDPSDPKQAWSADKILLGALAVYLLAGIPMVGMYALWGDRLLVLLTDKDFVLPRWVIVTLAMVRLLQCLDILFRCIFSVHMKANRLLGFRLANVAVALPVYWVAIRRYGIPGAVASKLLVLGLYSLVVIFGPKGCFWLFRQDRKAAGALHPIG